MKIILLTMLALVLLASCRFDSLIEINKYPAEVTVCDPPFSAASEAKWIKLTAKSLND